VESLKVTSDVYSSGTTGSTRRGGQSREDDVVDVGAWEAVRAGVVLEGCDHPLLGLDRREPGQAGALHELEYRVVR
jgi:hypothetical protein